VASAANENGRRHGLRAAEQEQHGGSGAAVRWDVGHRQQSASWAAAQAGRPYRSLHRMRKGQRQAGLSHRPLDGGRTMGDPPPPPSLISLL